MVSKNFDSNPAAHEIAMDAEQAAEYVGCGVKHVNRMARTGQIPAYNVGSGMKRQHWRFIPSQLDEWRRSRSNMSLSVRASDECVSPEKR